MIRDLGIVGCWFGNDVARRNAADRGVAALARLLPAPACGYLLNFGGQSFADWPWVQRMATPGPEHAGIWHKEALWNMAAAALLLDNPQVTKLLFCDLDVHPDYGDADWMAKTSAMLDRVEVGHPWSYVYESGSWDTPWESYSLSRGLGMKRVSSGHGFAVAMTRRWFEACGGWPDNCMSGGGDVVATMLWDCQAEDTAALVGMKDSGYGGPTAQYGYANATLVHESHGPRCGEQTTRRYAVACLLWEWCGGAEAVLEKDPQGFWRWQDSRLARAVRETLEAAPRTGVEMLHAWRVTCARNEVEPGRGDQRQGHAESEV